MPNDAANGKADSGQMPNDAANGKADTQSYEDGLDMFLEGAALYHKGRLQELEGLLLAGRGLNCMRPFVAHGGWGAILSRGKVSSQNASNWRQLATIADRRGLLVQQIQDAGGMMAVIKWDADFLPCGHRSQFKAPNGDCCECAYEELPVDEDYSEDYNECLNSDYHDFGVIAFHGMDKAFVYACTREGCDAEISQSEMRNRRAWEDRAQHALPDPCWAEKQRAEWDRADALVQFAPDTHWSDTGIQFSAPDTH